MNDNLRHEFIYEDSPNPIWIRVLGLPIKIIFGPIIIAVQCLLSMFGYSVYSDKAIHNIKVHARLTERNEVIKDTIDTLSPCFTSLREITKDLTKNLRINDAEEIAFCRNVLGSLCSFVPAAFSRTNTPFRIPNTLEEKLLTRSFNVVGRSLSSEHFENARAGSWRDALFIVELIVGDHFYGSWNEYSVSSITGTGETTQF